MAYSEKVAENVRAEAARRRMTGTGLAAVLGISPMSMSRRMNGHQPFGVDEIAAVALALGVPVHTLMPEVAGAGFEPATSGSRVVTPVERTMPVWGGRRLRLVGSSPSGHAA